MNAKMAMAWVLAAGMWVAGGLGQEGGSSQIVGETRGLNPEEGGDVLAFSGLDGSSDGCITIHLDLVAGVEYTIQGASSLLDGWTTLKSWVADTSGVASVEVEPDGAHFFRIAMGEGPGTEVLSANAVGYTSFTIPAGGKQMVSVPFDNPASDDGRFRFGDTPMAKDLPVGSVVYFWDGERQAWNGGMKSAFGWDPAEANHVLQEGEGFAVLNPTPADMEVSVAGEVPFDERKLHSFAGDSQLSVMACPYPVDVKFGNTELADQLPKGSSVLFWDSNVQCWSSWAKGTKGWSQAAANRMLECGEAFFIKTDYEGIWEAVKPYTWP